MLPVYRRHGPGPIAMPTMFRLLPAQPAWYVYRRKGRHRMVLSFRVAGSAFLCPRLGPWPGSTVIMRAGRAIGVWLPQACQPPPPCHLFPSKRNRLRKFRSRFLYWQFQFSGNCYIASEPPSPSGHGPEPLKVAVTFTVTNVGFTQFFILLAPSANQS